MRALHLVRRIGLALVLVILSVSGMYVVIDLARWEWNRAVMSALVFLSALVVLVAMLLIRQLSRLEQRMSDLERQRRDESETAGVIRASNSAAARHRFRWLESPTDRFSVFVPVLLGAGVILSFVAYLIERIAGAFAASALDPRTVRRLALDLPLGRGLVERTANLTPATTGSTSTARARAGRVAALVVTALLAVASVQGLRILTQTRPGEVTGPGATSIVVDIEQRSQIRPVNVVAEELWSSCRSRVRGEAELIGIAPDHGGRVTLSLDHALGRSGRARITGCIEDYTLDLVRADVISIVSVPLDRT